MLIRRSSLARTAQSQPRSRVLVVASAGRGRRRPRRDRSYGRLTRQTIHIPQPCTDTLDDCTPLNTPCFTLERCHVLQPAAAAESEFRSPTAIFRQKANSSHESTLQSRSQSRETQLLHARSSLRTRTMATIFNTDRTILQKKRLRRLILHE